MKNTILSLALVSLLSGCVIAPIPGRGEVVVRPSVEISYVWDNVRLRYYYVERGQRVYMPRDWHDSRHPHGGPPGQRKKHKNKHKDRDDD